MAADCWRASLSVTLLVCIGALGACRSNSVGVTPPPVAHPGGNGGSGGTAAAGAGSGGAPVVAPFVPSTPQTCKPPAARNAAATLLSETGCMQPQDPREPVPSLIPYEVASPLWSDGAAKRRFVALPEGGKIRVKDCIRTPALCGPTAEGGTYEDEGHFELPDGTVLVKSFELGGKMVETRLLVRIDRDNFWGYSYQWNEQQTDALLLASNTDGYEVALAEPPPGQIWHFPSRQQCLQCHTSAAGVSLGLETAQLNVAYAYPGGAVENQLDVWERLGLFESAPVRAQAYAQADDQQRSAEERARAYLHVNCAICHRAGTAAPDFEASYDTPLGGMGICNVPPDKGDLGVQGALRLWPGEPERSVLSLRMHSVQPMTRMPQIGTKLVDTAGVAAVDAWIRSLAACP